MAVFHNEVASQLELCPSKCLLLGTNVRGSDFILSASVFVHVFTLPGVLERGHFEHMNWRTNGKITTSCFEPAHGKQENISKEGPKTQFIL